MKISLENKHAIVCGSTDGIGKATALILASNGCEITLVSRNQDKLEKTCSELNTDDNQIHGIICADFNYPNNLRNVINSYLETLGKPVDILINNSGGPPGGPLIEADEDEFRNAFERLLICNHIMAKAVFPGMREQRAGRIINIIVMVSIFGGYFLFNALPYNLILWVIIAAYSIITLFSFVTLPVEFDASNRALAWIKQNGVVNSSEYNHSKDALKWAALTYVVAALGSLVTLLYYISLLAGRRD